MDVDGGIGFDPAGVVESAQLAERVGYGGLWSAEVNHDPFLPLALAAEHTERIKLGTGIAVAFARNPMTLAMVANDLQTLSRGRFMLGLGSQIKPHIEKRFSMPWSHPAPRMRELILAIRAIWKSWSDGSRLAFRGEYYTHTLMTPMFDPGPNPYGAPRIFLAAVGQKMTEVAGQVADGMLAHGFSTERYLREVTLPA
ncbi:MAG TPA: TIGR03617 family F420-dependent LLM class oxidoreductase, partial [Acidimicrobiales bacterium]|nr:TIGR03617 family F420-dependent LLM class oxidoreductase [Acidimicrobiales bacterium]